MNTPLQNALLNRNVVAIRMLVADGATLSKELATELLISNDIDKINVLSEAGAIENGLFDVVDITDPEVTKAIIETNHKALIQRCLAQKNSYQLKIDILKSRNNDIELLNSLFTPDFALPHDEERAVLREVIQNHSQKKIDYLKAKGIMLANHTDLVDLAIDSLMPTEAQTEELLRFNLSEEQLSHLLAQAIKYGAHPVFNLLVSRDMISNPQYLQQPLLAAIDKGDSEIVRQLIQMGANPCTDVIMKKAVTAAVPNPKVINVLFDCGADPRALGCRLPVIAVERYLALNNVQYHEIIKILLNKIVNNPSKVDDILKKYHDKVMSASLFQTAVKFLIKQSLSKPHQLAFDLLNIQNDYVKRSTESAGDASLSRRANAHFSSKVEPLLLKKFNTYPGNTQLEKIEAIEKELKSYLLSQIKLACQTEPSNDNRLIVDFIEKNADALIQGTNKLLMSEFRRLLTSNEMSAQVAWRAYDPDAPYKQDFENLLTPQLSKQKIYTTSASADTQLSANEASLLSRYRMAIYFLEIQQLNQINFIQQLADIRRANATGPMDCPSCFPGTIGRIAKLGEGHPILQLPPTRREIITNQINAMVIKAFADYIEEHGYQKSLDLYLSLVAIRPENAADVISGKVAFDEDMLSLRQGFIKQIFANNKHTAIINAALEAVHEPPLNDSDSLDIMKESMDIAAFGRAMQLYQRLNAFKNQVLEQQPIAEQAPTAVSSNNPFIVAKASLPGNLSADRKKQIMHDRLARFIEFEIASEIFAQYFPSNQGDLAKSWVNELFATAKVPSEVHRIQTFDNMLANERMLLNQAPELSEKLKQALVEAGDWSKKDEAKLNKLISRVMDAHATNDPIFKTLLQGSLNTVISQLLDQNKPGSTPRP